MSSYFAKDPIKMNNLKINTAYGLTALSCLSLRSCVQVSVPPAPDMTTDSGETCPEVECNCQTGGMADSRWATSERPKLRSQ